MVIAVEKPAETHSPIQSQAASQLYTRVAYSWSGGHEFESPERQNLASKLNVENPGARSSAMN